MVAASDAQIVLDYVRALEWWALAAIILFAARRRIADLPGAIGKFFRDKPVQEVKVGPSGLALKFQAAKSEEKAAVPDLAAPDGAVTSEVFQAVRARAELLETLAVIFASQIRYLQEIRKSPDGLTADAANAWFFTLQQTSQSYNAWTLETFESYPRVRGLLNVDDDATRRITNEGRAFLDFEANFWYSEKLF